MNKSFDKSDIKAFLIIAAFVFLSAAFLRIIEIGNTSKRVEPGNSDLIYQEGLIEQPYQYDPAAIELDSDFWNGED